jgi:thiamine kinase-like enzyme
LDVPETIDLSDALKGAREAMTASDVAWVEGLVRRVENITSPVSRFVHNDLHALNIMIANDRLSGVIDWGDAGWGDPALNFTSFPAEYLPDALTEFGDEDYELIGSCLREVVGYALYCIGEGKPADGAALQIGQKRWASLLSLWDQPLTAAWRDWVKDPPNLRKDQ